MISPWALRTSLLLLATMALASLAGWAALPADLSVPMHYDIEGEVDRYGSLIEGLVALPLIALGVFALILFLARYEPRIDHLKRGRQALDWSLVGTMALICAVHLASLAVAAGWPVPIPTLVMLGAGALFIVIGNFLPKTRSNFLIGVRTPWTLSSEHSWFKTHRLAGRGFVALGSLAIAATLASPRLALWVLVVGVGLLTIGLFAASWYYWRRDDAARG